jgi:N-acetylglucosaminyl-diphospho-decaprenol L-rhamnosyltransferase
MPEIALSFIFVNYRSARFLGSALASLEPISARVATQYIIINNDLTEKVQVDELAKKFGADVEHFPENRGFGAANNAGARRARGTVLFFINPDTRYTSGDIQELLSTVKREPQTVFGTALIDPSGQRERWSSGPLPSLRTLVGSKLFPRLFPRPWRAETVTEVGWVSGAALLIPKEFFMTIGGFDERFFLYYEDVDLCARARARGGRVVLFPSLIWRHERGGSQTDYASTKRFYRDSQRRYFSKHRPRYESRVLGFLQQFLPDHSV